MSTLSFENLERHIGHRIVCAGHGLPPQNVVLHCLDCEEVIIDLDAEGESLFGLILITPSPDDPPEPIALVPPEEAATIALAAAA
jgi:hypothetical protein